MKKYRDPRFRAPLGLARSTNPNSRDRRSSDISATNRNSVRKVSAINLNTLPAGATTDDKLNMIVARFNELIDFMQEVRQMDG